jgi:predicted kinase
MAIAPAVGYRFLPSRNLGPANGANTMLIVLSGLPGTGKSSIARPLSRQLKAAWLRIDSIEQAIRDSGVLRDSVDGSGYEVACRVAEDNLALDVTVIADCVNPWMLTRDAWRAVGTRAGVPVLEIETVCSDLVEHRRRIETRGAQVRGMKQLTWEEVAGRDYQPWNRDHLTLDTARHSIDDCVRQIVGLVATT